MKGILLFVALVVYVSAQAPNPPTWPTAFDSSILALDNMGGMRFFRWFYDSGNNVERHDGLRMWNGEMFWIEDLKDYDTQVNTFMAFMFDEVSCFTRPTNGTLIEPDFTQFTWIGLSLVGFRTCNHWILEDSKDGFFFMLWDDSTTRELVRINIVNQNNGFDETWTFMEMNVGAQDQNLFVVPTIIESICTAGTQEQLPIMSYNN